MKIQPEIIPPEDLGELAGSLQRPFDALNRFIRRVAQLSDRGIGQENLAGMVKTFTVDTPDDWTPLGFVAGWARHADTSFPQPAWRQGADGRVYLRGLIGRVGAPVPGEVVVTGLPAPKGRERLATEQEDRHAVLDINNSGSATWVSGHTSAAYLTLSGLSYDPAVRAPAVRAPFPLRVELKGFPGRPKYLQVLRVDGPYHALGYPVWEPSASEKGEPAILIRALPGLQPLARYTLTVSITAS